MTKVAVLLASFNGEQHIDEQLATVLNQTFDDFVLYISDDGSTDRTSDIIRRNMELDDRVQLIPPPPGPIRSAERNFLHLAKYIQHFGYEYILFCDQDDVWMPEKISVQMSELDILTRTHGEFTPLLVHSDLVLIDSKGLEIANSYFRHARIYLKDDCWLSYLVSNRVTGCTICMNAALLRAFVQIDTLPMLHDWWLGVYAARFGAVRTNFASLVKYRQHDRNVIGAGKRWSAVELADRLLSKRLLSSFTQLVYLSKACNDHFEKKISLVRLVVLKLRIIGSRAFGVHNRHV